MTNQTTTDTPPVLMQVGHALNMVCALWDAPVQIEAAGSAADIITAQCVQHAAKEAFSNNCAILAEFFTNDRWEFDSIVAEEWAPEFKPQHPEMLKEIVDEADEHVRALGGARRTDPLHTVTRGQRMLRVITLMLNASEFEEELRRIGHPDADLWGAYVLTAAALLNAE